MAETRTIPEKVKGAAVTFTIKIDGKAIPRTYEVFAISIIKEVNRIPTAKLSLIDGDPAKEKFVASNDSLFLPGNEISVYVGQQGKEDLIFKGIVIKHAIAVRKNGHSQLRLDCKDQVYTLALGNRSAQFKDMKDSEIADAIFSKNKITVSNIEPTKYKHPEMVQFNCSDWDFLLERMDVNGKMVFVNEGKVEIKGPDFSNPVSLTLQYGATIHEMDAEMDARNQYKAVKAITWDAVNQELLEVEGQTPAAVKEAGNFSASDLSQVNKQEVWRLFHGGNLSSVELQSWADACRQKSLLAKIRGRVTFDGYAKLLTGDLIECKGLGDRFNGKLFVSAVRHDISNGGWTTSAQFGMEPDWYVQKLGAGSHSNSNSSLLPSVSGLHTGIVAQLEKDPKGEDRILVKVPIVDMAAEGVWARVATLDAGKERGSFFRPDIGDEVLVGFLNNDPREVIVLGMLNSSKKPAPLTAKDENKEKGFFFSSKMKVLFNEEDKSMLFETPAGNKLAISEKEKGIAFQDQNGNKIMLNKDGITIESSKKIILKAPGSDIELEGVNIKQTAQAQLKAEGSAGIEVSSSGIAKLKGSLVQIN